MITTDCVDDDLIEQFIDRAEDHPDVEHVRISHGRAVDVRLRPHYDTNKPWADWDDVEFVDGAWHGDDFVVSNLAGGGTTPNGGYTTRVGVSPYCVACGDKPQSYDGGLCGSCNVHEGLLTGPAGETAIVQAVHDDDTNGTLTDPDQTFEATADDDGILRATLEGLDGEEDEQPLNANAHSIVRWKANGDY